MQQSLREMQALAGVPVCEEYNYGGPCTIIMITEDRQLHTWKGKTFNDVMEKIESHYEGEITHFLEALGVPTDHPHYGDYSQYQPKGEHLGTDHIGQDFIFLPW